MDGVLSQEEINALLNNNDAADSSDEILTESEKDAIGEIANISMGTAATTLFSLVNRRVEIGHADIFLDRYAYTPSII